VKEGERQKQWTVEMEIGRALFGATTTQEHVRESERERERAYAEFGVESLNCLLKKQRRETEGVGERQVLKIVVDEGRRWK